MHFELLFDDIEALCVWKINRNISFGNQYVFEHIIFLLKINTIIRVKISKIFIVKFPKIYVFILSDWNCDFDWFCYAFETVIFCIENLLSRKYRFFGRFFNYYFQTNLIFILIHVSSHRFFSYKMIIKILWFWQVKKTYGF